MIRKTFLYFAFALVALFLMPAGTEAQNLSRGKVSVDNVEVNRIGTILYISYDLKFGPGVQSCVTSLDVSLDGGANFSNVASSDKLTGDLGRMTTRGKKEIRYDISDVRSQYAGREIVFDVKADRVVALKPKVLATVGTTVYPFASAYGAMVGYADKFGGYVHYRTNFKSAGATASYTCTSDGKTSDGGIFWGDDSMSASMMNISAGALLRISTWLYPYVGVGYGKRDVVRRDYNSELVEVTDKKFSGVTFEGGFVICLGHFSLSAGASNLASADGFGIDLGIGFNF